MRDEENHERVDLGERTKKFGLRIVRMFGALPKSNEAQVIGKQVLRSGASVGANCREAYRSRSDAEFIAKIGDCLKQLDESDLDRAFGHSEMRYKPAAPASERAHGTCEKSLLAHRVSVAESEIKADESSYRLELIVEADLVASERPADLHDECNQLFAILATISKKVKNRVR